MSDFLPQGIYKRRNWYVLLIPPPPENAWEQTMRRYKMRILKDVGSKHIIEDYLSDCTIIEEHFELVTELPVLRENLIDKIVEYL